MKKIETEDVLWAKLKAGNIKAIGDIYDLFIDDLFAYGIQISVDKDFVMDCIHDLFLDLYKYKKKLSKTNNIKYYLLKSLKNKILKKGKENPIYLNSDIFEKVNDTMNFSKSYEETLIESEILDERLLKLSNTICFLSKKQRQVLFLRFTEEKDYEEISKIMNVSVQTSRTIIYRAIKVLRKHLALLFFYGLNMF